LKPEFVYCLALALAFCGGAAAQTLRLQPSLFRKNVTWGLMVIGARECAFIVALGLFVWGFFRFSWWLPIVVGLAAYLGAFLLMLPITRIFGKRENVRLAALGCVAYVSTSVGFSVMLWRA
jgi:hypothetical protein